MKLTGSEIILECLLREGVDVMFGYPGGAILPTYDAMTKYLDRIHHVLVRHEQGASHMADGYARATGKVGVCIATSGPGATNLITGLATAMMDSSPIIAITGQVPVSAIGSDAFQETDVTGATLPVTKHNYLVTDASELAYTIKEAFYIARTGRPGPVLIDVPKDVQNQVVEFVYPEGEIRLPGYQPPSAALEEQIVAALELIHNAERPVILGGHGITLSGANNEAREFAEICNIPIAQTLLGKGSVPEEHPLVIGWMGMHGDAAVNHAIQEADLLIALGMRFDDRVTGNLATYSPHSKKIHIDIDPAELNKVVKADVAINGDLKTVLRQWLPRLQQRSHANWLNRIRDWQEDSNERDILNHDSGGKLLTAQVINDLWKYTDGNALTVSDVGQHQMLEAQYYPHQRPSTMLTSGGLGTMGFGLPAAIGAKFGKPDEDVWAVVGDGGVQMTICELATARQENININIAIINNSFLGMVRQWQELFYDKRYSATPMFSPDFCKLAEAYSIPSMRVTSRDQIEESVAFAQSIDGPVLIEYVVEKDEMVYPMVAAGADLDDMKRRPKPGEKV
ncbi:MAG: biosynthetic-type acetolactate synthase large subunit [Phototrophicaceae bacterium]